MAPRMYYLGYAGVIKFGGLRIAGLSGIYKHHDFQKGEVEGVFCLCAVYALTNLMLHFSKFVFYCMYLPCIILTSFSLAVQTT